MINKTISGDLDKTPLSYVSLGKYTFNLKDSITASIKGVDDKRQIIAAFTVPTSVLFYLLNSSIMVTSNVAYPNTIALISLMLHSLQIIDPILKNM